MKAFIVWLVSLAAIVVFGYLLMGCGGSKAKDPDVPRLLTCAEKVVKIVTETPNCEDIKQKIGELLDAQAECFEALTGEKAPTWTCGDGGN